MKYLGPFTCRFCRVERGKLHQAGCPRLRKTSRSRRRAEKAFNKGYNHSNATEVPWRSNSSYNLGLKFAKNWDFAKNYYGTKRDVFWNTGF